MVRLHSNFRMNCVKFYFKNGTATKLKFNYFEYIQIQNIDSFSAQQEEYINMDCTKHTGEIKCAHYYCAICKHCNKIICHTCLLEEELYDLDLIYGDDDVCDYDAYDNDDVGNDSVGNKDDQVTMPPLEPWTPTKK